MSSLGEGETEVSEEDDTLQTAEDGSYILTNLDKIKEEKRNKNAERLYAV